MTESEAKAYISKLTLEEKRQLNNLLKALETQRMEGRDENQDRA